MNQTLCDVLHVTPNLKLVGCEVNLLEENLREKSRRMQAKGESDVADEIAALADKLRAFADKFQALGVKWDMLKADCEGAGSEMQKTLQAVAKAWKASTRPSKKSRLTVRFPLPNGERVISHHQASDTFAEAIQRLGPEKVARCNLSIGGNPLVTRDREDIVNKRIFVKPLLDGWFLSSPSSPKEFAKRLKEISSQLLESLEVEVASDMDNSFTKVSAHLDCVMDNVNKAHDAILGEIQKLSDLGKREIADKAAAFVEKFKTFADENAAVYCEWKNLENDLVNASPEVREIIRTATTGTGPTMETTLKVTFSDGRVVQEEKGADTFAKTIERLNAERVAKLGLQSSGGPLVTRDKEELVNIPCLRRYPRSIRTIADGWYVNTHFDNNKRICLLTEISKLLEADLKIEELTCIS